MKVKSCIVLFGKSGQLGQSFEELRSLIDGDFEFYSFSRKEADILKLNELQTIKEKYRPNYIINCAAYTAVDKAESQVEESIQVNKTGIANLVEIFGEDARIIHYSTDYVYNLETIFPLLELDHCSPSGQYATSKYLGEKELFLTQDKHILIRTSWVYSPYGTNFVKTMLRLAKQNKEIRVVGDQIGGPTYALDLAEATIQILKYLDEAGLSYSFGGIYNYANEGTISWYDFAKSIFKISGLDINIKKINSEEYPTAAKRPKWSKMNLNKIKATFDIVIPHWRASLKKCLDKISLGD